MFKLSALTLLLLLGQSLSALAVNLIAVEKHSGYVIPENSYALKCMLGSTTTNYHADVGDRRHFTRIFRTRYTRSVPHARAAMDLIRRATLGTLQTSPGHTDGPTASYYGILGDVRVLLLNDQSIRITRNNAPGVSALIAFANLNCPIPR